MTTQLRLIALLFTCLPALAFAQARPAINLVEGLYAESYDHRATPRQGALTYRHTRTWAAGDNLFFVDVSNLGNFENAGATYAEWGPRLSLGKTLRDRALAFGPVRDVYVMGELNYIHNKNAVNLVRLQGLSVDLAVPGFTVFKLHLEQRNDPDLPGHTGQVSWIWNRPFTVAGRNFSFEGFMDLVGTEGRSKGNLHMQPQLLWRADQHWGFGLEYLYWRNKNGRKGLTESVTQAMVRYTF